MFAGKTLLITGGTGSFHGVEYNSNNTEQLDVEGVKAKLLQVEYIQNELEKWGRRP
jgi:FlaA1/EpsC-like NDP-sugar epimerase